MSETALEDEVRQALRELVDEIGAVSARIVENDDLRTGVPARTLALGGGEYLRVELGTRTNHEHTIEPAFERITRQLRAIRRRWEVARLPEIMVSPGLVPSKDRVTDRISTYLQGLASIDRASNAFVIRSKHGAAPVLIASAREPDEAEASRWQFLARRAFNTHAPGSSYGEIVDLEAYAMSFWYDCALIVLLSDPYGIDFVRHRCRHVARELVNLLPMLDPDPETPAAVRRRPPTLS
ncbi:MAG: hypothetical protein H0T42_02290 [Deltaproteobacteria bacterium]|nr:hypothetical protein [Deltaproteobacteria bacterium]